MTSTHMLSCWIPVVWNRLTSRCPQILQKSHFQLLKSSAPFCTFQKMKPLEAINTLATYSHSYENWSSEVGKAWLLSQSTSIVIENLFGYWFTFYDMLPLIAPCFIFKSTQYFFPRTAIPIQIWPEILLSGGSVTGSKTFSNINDFDSDIAKLMNYILYAHQILLLQFPTNSFKAKELVGGCRHKGCLLVKEWGEAD